VLSTVAVEQDAGIVKIVLGGGGGRNESISDLDVAKAENKTREDPNPYSYSSEYAADFSCNVSIRFIGVDSCSSVNIF